jgi:hypothetical protein
LNLKQEILIVFSNKLNNRSPVLSLGLSRFVRQQLQPCAARKDCMKTRVLLFLALAIFSPICIAQAHDPEAILRACGNAMGGGNQQVDFTAEGSLQMANAETAEHVLIKTRGLESFRMERGESGQPEVSIISRGRGARHGAAPKTAMSRQDTAYFKADHLPALMCAISPVKDGMQLSYVGEDIVGGRPTFHLKLNAIPKRRNAHADLIESLISEFHLFIDQQSFVVLKSAKYVFSPTAIENRSWWETLYSDYRPVNGVQMPFRLEILVAGQPFSTTTFSTITSVTLLDQDFEEAN